MAKEKKTKTFQYGPITVSVKRNGKYLFEVTVHDNIGNTFDSLFDSSEQRENGVAKSVVHSLGDELSSARPWNRHKLSYETFKGKTSVEVRDAAVAFGPAIHEAMEVIYRIEADDRAEYESSELGARYPSGKKYAHQYGNLLVTVFSEHGVYYANVKDGSGYEVGLETPEQSILQAARYALSVLANPGENPHPELLEASKVLGEEAYQAILDVEEGRDGDAEMSGSGRYQADCSFNCPAKGNVDFAIWPRKGETANEACMRGLRDRVDAPQVEHCIKIRARYIE